MNYLIILLLVLCLIALTSLAGALAVGGDVSGHLQAAAIATGSIVAVALLVGRR